MRRIAAVGFTCVDVYEDGTYYATGNGLSMLFNLLDLRDDVAGSVVSAVGDDAYGRRMLAACRAHGVDSSHIRVIPGGTTAYVEMRMNGRERVFHRTERGVITDYAPDGAEMDFIRSQDLIHTDLSWKVTDHLADMRKNGTKIYFDFSKRWQHPDVDRILRNIDYGIFSFEERTQEVEELLRRGCGLGARILLATFGEHGSLAYDGTKFYEAKAEPCRRLVSTCGAGDSFGAGFLSGLFSGKTVPESMEIGAKRAAQVVEWVEPYRARPLPEGGTET